jgi:hypothetical protein
MRPDRADRAVPVDLAPVDLGLGRAALGGLRLAARVDLVGLMGPAALGGRPRLGPVGLEVPVVLGRVDLDRVDLGLVDPVDLMGLAAPVDRHRMVPAVLGPVVLGRVDLADLTDRTALVGPVVQDRMGLAAPVVRMAVVLAAPAVRMARVVLAAPVGLNTAARAAPVVRMAPAVLVGLAAPVDLAVLEDLAAPEDLVDLDTVGRVVLVVLVDRRRRPTCNRVTMTEVARNGVVRGTHRTASALQVTARPHLRLQTDSGGMAGLLPERRRPTGTVHLLLAVGTVRRPPEAGTLTGTDRRTISAGDRRTMASSTTTAITPHRSLTRCSVAGASGSSVPGSRSTDLSPA